MVEAVLYGLIAPLVLAIVASVWHYPPVLEELVKWGILTVAHEKTRVSWLTGLYVGLAFGVSEAVLYSLNGWSSAGAETLMLRLVLTVPMHGIAGAITGYGVSRRLGYLFLILAMVLHRLFNYWVTN